MKTGFILHYDSLSILDELSNEQAGILFKALKDYSLGIEPELDFAMRMAFIPFKNQFERDAKKYDKVVERNKNNGSKGGRPRKPNKTEKTQSVFEEPKKADNKNNNKNDNNNNIDYLALLEYINNSFDRKFKLIPDKVKKQYLTRLKEGYTKQDVITAINNCKQNKFHIENNYQYCTPEFFSRSENLEKYSNVTKQNKKIEAFHPVIFD